MSNIFCCRVVRRLWPASLVIALALLLAVCAAAAPVSNSNNPKTTLPPASVGQWAAPVDWGVWAIHLALLHTGKVVGYGYPQGTETMVPAVLYDTVTHTTKDITPPVPGDFFCEIGRAHV